MYQKWWRRIERIGPSVDVGESYDVPQVNNQKGFGARAVTCQAVTTTSAS